MVLFTLTEENYLKAIYSLSQVGKGTVTTNEIASRLSTRAATVTDMLKKLSIKKCVNYEKYQGVVLTRKGESAALSVIRRHRLWELFLVEKLGFHWDEVHELAEELEHVRFEQLTSRLDSFLGFPSHDPHGDPIPDQKGKIPANRSILLSEIKEGTHCKMTGVRDHSVAFLRFLDKSGLHPGCRFSVREIAEYDQALTISFKGKAELYISPLAARNILVIPQISA